MAACYRYARSPTAFPHRRANGSPASLRDEMGLFPLAVTPSPIRPSPHFRTARYCWPNLLWRHYAANIRQHMNGNGPLQSAPSRPATSRPQSQFRAIFRQSAHRASQCIQLAPLSRRRSSTATTLRRWMRPTVERGPPVSERFSLDVSKTFTNAVEQLNHPFP